MARPYRWWENKRSNNNNGKMWFSRSGVLKTTSIFSFRYFRRIVAVVRRCSLFRNTSVSSCVWCGDGSCVHCVCVCVYGTMEERMNIRFNVIPHPVAQCTLHSAKHATCNHNTTISTKQHHSLQCLGKTGNFSPEMMQIVLDFLFSKMESFISPQSSQRAPQSNDIRDCGSCRDWIMFWYRLLDPQSFTTHR